MAVNKGGHIDFRGYQPSGALEGTAGTLLLTAAQTTTGADTRHDIYTIGNSTFSIYHAAAGTTWIPEQTAQGLALPSDITVDEGAILTVGGGLAGANSRYCFTVGTDAPFFMRWVGYMADPTVADLIAAAGFFIGGFRTAGQYAAANAVAQWPDIGATGTMIGADANPFGTMAMVGPACTATADIYSVFKNSSAAGTETDTTLNAADATAFTVEIRVSAAGVVTGYVGGSILTTPASGVLGTVTAGVVLQPSIMAMNGASAAAANQHIVQSITWGLQ